MSVVAEPMFPLKNCLNILYRIVAFYTHAPYHAAHVARDDPLWLVHPGDCGVGVERLVRQGSLSQRYRVNLKYWHGLCLAGDDPSLKLTMPIVQMGCSEDRTMKKTLSLISILALGAGLSIVGCSGDDDDTGGPGAGGVLNGDGDGDGDGDGSGGTGAGGGIGMGASSGMGASGGIGGAGN